MNPATLVEQIRHSPAFVLDMDQVLLNLQALQHIRQASGCKLLYSMKALPLAALLSALKPHIDGVSVSSLFEARLANDVFNTQGGLHLTSPGLRADEFSELARLCSHISFNSLSQFQQFNPMALDYSKGIRVNPKLSFAADVRYDPCRLHSKLGVDLEQLQTDFPVGLEGIHFHTIHGHRDFAPLQAVLRKMQPFLERHGRLKWLNLGGGYDYSGIRDLEPCIAMIRNLKTHFAEEVFLEPGKALVGNAAYLYTRVLDRFNSDGKTLLILDTSVNHHPEVFEYQIKPSLLTEAVDGRQGAILAGSSCLAGDVFGEYRFHTLPGVGDTLVFTGVGAYSLIKANRFNGYALPTVYQHQSQQIKLLKLDSYAEYHRQWGGVW